MVPPMGDGNLALSKAYDYDESESDANRDKLRVATDHQVRKMRRIKIRRDIIFSITRPLVGIL